MGRGRGRGRGGGGGGARPPRVCEEEEEYMARLAGQDPRAGRMPSDDEESEDEGVQIGQIDHEPVISRQRNSRGQNSNVGMMPPSDSEEESGEESEGEEIVPHGAAPSEPEPRRRKDDPEEPDEEQIAKDMERLKLIKDRREKERQARITREGWDRFSPVTETNKPPTGEGRPEDEE